MDATQQPLISIIMATYNRSNVLAYAIESVLAQTYENWELLVVGDACTDDTGDVVASFADPRIRFMNLEENVGEQSGPNNVGFAHARGDFMAYLNHDDLWFPDHLAVTYEHIQNTGADLAHTLVDFIHHDRPNEIGCITPGGNYHPTAFVPASCWLVRRSCVEEIGAWSFYQTCHLVPSQDWLFRAWKRKKRLCMVPALTVAAIQSGKREGVYAHREYEENRRVWEQMKNDPGFRQHELANYLASQPGPVLKHYGTWKLLRFGFRNAIARMLCTLGYHPYGLQIALRHRSKGALIDQARERRGLQRLAEKRETKHVQVN